MNNNTRPCIVIDGHDNERPALFHRWADGITSDGRSRTVAIVEYPDGTCISTYVETVRFTDRVIDEKEDRR